MATTKMEAQDYLLLKSLRLLARRSSPTIRAGARISRPRGQREARRQVCHTSRCQRSGRNQQRQTHSPRRRTRRRGALLRLDRDRQQVAKKLAVMRPLSQQSKQEQSKPLQGSVTPLMDTVHTPAPDNTSGQLGPSDIRRTRSLENGAGMKPPAGKPAVASSLGTYLLSRTHSRSGKIRHPMAELRPQKRLRRSKTA